MQCSACGTENPAAARFCEECGSGLARACRHCGHEVGPKAKFCSECGRSLAGARTADSRPASPESYTPRHLAEKILSSASALEGERKQVTVLFADLKGSMELLADRDPEEARKLLDPVLERMMEAIHRYEGTVNQVMGDGIMALFGAPLAHEDHAVRACYAALAMQAAIARYAEQMRRAEGIEVRIRVGLNSGEVVVRSIGSDLRMDYSAVGQTTHLAARMEQLATPGSVRLTAGTFRLAEGFVRVRALGPVPVKGLPEPAEVFELLDAGQARTRLQALAARGLTRFVGRQAELEALRKALALAGAGHGQLVAPVGEPGVGKSRLFYEFVRSQRTAGWLVLESGSVSYGKATSYLPVIELLKAYCRIESRDDPRTVREKLTGKLLALDRALEPTLPALLALLDVPVEDAAWQALDPPQRRARTLEACKRLLLRESREQPLLLVFEDLHWIDAETQALLDSLVESLPTARILLLVNYRPEYRHGWANKTYYTQLRIDPLPAESADELLGALLGEDPSVQPLRPLLIERTEGNPFFLEESVRTLAETGVLSGDKGAYGLVQPVADIRVPATVQAVLAARIDRLAPEDKRLLQAAAVIGKDVPFALLEAIAELPDDELQGGLARLQAGEFLYEASLFPDLEYTFKHALTHEVAYGSLLQERRRALHARIVDAIEALYPDRLAEQVERLGHHALRGERWDAAVAYLRQAGAKANARSANREAVAYFERALEALEHLPESRETIELAIDIRMDLRVAFLPLGELGRLHDRLRQAEALANTLADPRRLARISAQIGQYFWMIGDQDEALAANQRALAIAESLEDLALRTTATYYIGAAYHALGSYLDAREFLERTIALLQGDLIHQRFPWSATHMAVTSRNYLVESLAELGLFSEGIALGEEAVRIADEVDNPNAQAAASMGIGLVQLRKGELNKAAPALERGLEICQAADIPFWEPRVAAILGSTYALSGEFSAAVRLLEAAVAREASMELKVFHSLWVACLGEAYLLAGRMKDAETTARRALEVSRTHKERGNEAWSLRLLGEVAAHHEPPDVEQAAAQYRQALALAEKLEMRPLQAHCHLGLGMLYRKIGRPEEARAALSRAVEELRTLGMTFWLPRAEAALAKTR